jgi:hypothetical protein
VLSELPKYAIAHFACWVSCGGSFSEQFAV